MARCPSCNKMCGYDDGDPEIQDEQVDSDGQWSAEIRMVKTYACCGDEVRESTFEFSGEVPEEIMEQLRADHGDDLELEIEVTAENDEKRDTTKNGKPVP